MPPLLEVRFSVDRLTVRSLSVVAVPTFASPYRLIVAVERSIAVLPVTAMPPAVLVRFSVLPFFTSSVPFRVASFPRLIVALELSISASFATVRLPFGAVSVRLEPFRAYSLPARSALPFVSLTMAVALSRVMWLSPPTVLKSPAAEVTSIRALFARLSAPLNVASPLSLPVPVRVTVAEELFIAVVPVTVRPPALEVTFSTALLARSSVSSNVTPSFAVIVAEALFSVVAPATLMSPLALVTFSSALLARSSVFLSSTPSSSKMFAVAPFTISVVPLTMNLSLATSTPLASTLCRMFSTPPATVPFTVTMPLLPRMLSMMLALLAALSRFVPITTRLTMTSFAANRLAVLCTPSLSAPTITRLSMPMSPGFCALGLFLYLLYLPSAPSWRTLVWMRASPPLMTIRL